MLGLCRRLNYHISAGLYTQQKSTYFAEEDPGFIARRTEADRHEQRHADRQSYLHEDRRQGIDGHISGLNRNDLVHRPVEAAQHRRKGIVGRMK